MGLSILELVLRRLRESGFPADVAYPGQKFPRVTEPVAAAHIEKVDRAGMTVTVEVNIICPAALGGTTCEVEALRATEVLRWNGAVCIQNGCSYDGVSQVYVVQILATFTGVAEEDSFVNGPGFFVYINDKLHSGAQSVSGEAVLAAEPEYVMGEAAPKDSSTGSLGWNLRLEELIPVGYPEPEEPEGRFVLKILTDRKTEVYSGCRWTSVQREYTKEGLRRIRKGFALMREEV